MFDTSTPFDSTIPQPAPTPGLAPARRVAAGGVPLAPGTKLGEFEIVRVIGSGGFGIVYLANDRLLLRQVAIKEYLPATLAGRGRDQTVVVHHQSTARSFAAGLASFLNEAQLLARFDHPALVKVHRFWRANDTAYMAMPYYRGRTLKDERLAMRAAPSEAWLRGLAEPLLSALDLLHRQGVFHRDISPDNIIVRPGGRPVLLDFGSARHAVGDRTRMLTVMLKPNFAPVEQYGDDTSLRQGPWTDLYALGATLRFALTGKPPTPSVIRAVRDDLGPLASASLAPQDGAAPSVSPLFLAAIDWTLTVAPDGRPQDVAALRQVMRGETAVATHGVPNDDAPIRSRQWQPVVAAIGGSLLLLALSAAGWQAARTPAVATLPAASTPVTRPATPPAIVPRVAPVVVPQPTTAAAGSDMPRSAEGTPLVPRAARGDNYAPLRKRSAPPRSKVAGRAPPARLRVRPPSAASPALPLADTGAKAGPSNPATCGNLGFFARQLCVARQCASPEAQANPRCAERRRGDDERLRRTQP
jgi:serine/threonine protein kinase